MGITTTITCDGCGAVIPATSGYLRVLTEAVNGYKGEAPHMLLFCDANCVSKYVPAGA